MEFKIISKSYNFIKSFVSFVEINRLIRKSSKRIIFFYFPRRELTLKDIKYINNLFNDLKKKYLIIFGHKHFKIRLKNFYFLNEIFIKYLKNTDLFVSNYICDLFPNNTKKIYIHHSLYDTPLTGKKNEKSTIQRLKKYDYIFLSSKKVVKSFKKIFKINDKNIRIISTGYPRLDYLDKLKVRNKKTILIAPANIHAYPEYSMINSINEILKIIRKNTKHKVVFRPHPANREYFLDKSRTSFKENILSEIPFLNDVIIDVSEDYSKTYKNSAFMITDLSSTAFTYSFLTFNPVIFYSKNENIFEKKYKRLNHFKDRKKVGEIASNIEDLNKYIKKFVKKTHNYRKSIKLLRNKIDYLGKSKSLITNIMDKIINDKY